MLNSNQVASLIVDLKCSSPEQKLKYQYTLVSKIDTDTGELYGISAISFTAKLFVNAVTNDIKKERKRVIKLLEEMHKGYVVEYTGVFTEDEFKKIRSKSF